MIPLMLLIDQEYRLKDKMFEQRNRRCLRIQRNVLELPTYRFIKNYRVPLHVFEEIVREVQLEITPIKSHGITAEQKVATTLRFLAEGSYQQSVGKDFFVPVARTTFSKILGQVLPVMERKLCPKYIRLEMADAERISANEFFLVKSGISGVAMCVDGTHIKIMRPKCNEHLYYNRKGYFSINAMIVCDNKQRIRFVNAKFGGASHDSHVWNRSPVGRYFEFKQSSYETGFKILGDSAYPRANWLIVPYRNAESNSAEAEFNRLHTSGRIIIEKTIGVLKSRFRCLSGQRELLHAPEKCLKIINVCCALHNMCINYNL